MGVVTSVGVRRWVWGRGLLYMQVLGDVVWVWLQV